MSKEKVNYDFMKEFANDVEGYEGMNQDTMAIPFIRIIQALSPQLKKSKPEFIPEASEGDICDSITGTLYDKPLRIVIGKFEHLMIEWKPNRGGYVQAHDPVMIAKNPQRYQMCDNGKGGFELRDMQTGNNIVETYMYYVLLPDHLEQGIMVLSLYSTALKEAKKLNRLLKTSYIPGTNIKAAPHFMIWKLDSIEMSKDQHTWFGPQFTFDSFVTPELLEHAMSERKELPNKTVDYALIDENAGKATQSSEPTQNPY